MKDELNSSQFRYSIQPPSPDSLTLESHSEQTDLAIGMEETESNA